MHKRARDLGQVATGGRGSGTRLSLSFDFSRIKFARAKKVRKGAGEGEPGDEARSHIGVGTGGARGAIAPQYFGKGGRAPLNLQPSIVTIQTF